MTTTTTSTLPLPVQQYYDNILLTTPTPNLIHSYGSTKKSLPGKNSDIIRMERYSLLDAATVPLGNSGINPPAQSLSSVFINAKVEFYGTYVVINEQLPVTSQSPVLNQATLMLGESMRRTEDILMRDILKTTASAHDCTGGVNGDSVTEITLSDVQDIVKTLLAADAKTMADMVEAQNKFGTAPVPRSFYAMGHSDMSSALANVPKFQGTWEYPNQANIKSTEWGSISQVRFFLSSIGSIDKEASRFGNDVYNNFVCGMDSYAQVKLNNYKAQTVYRDGKIAGGPLALNQTMGYKMAEAPVVTNDAWVINLRCTL
jgi:N4-gp56 family major capsid protein